MTNYFHKLQYTSSLFLYRSELLKNGSSYILFTIHSKNIDSFSRTSFGPARLGHEQLSRVGRPRARAKCFDEDAALRQVPSRPPIAKTSDRGHLRNLLYPSRSDADENTQTTNVSYREG